MSLARVQHIAISLDGFAIGEGQSLVEPFGHAGERLHEWMMLGQLGGTGGVDDAFLRLFAPGIGSEILGAGKFGHPGWARGPGVEGLVGSQPAFHTPVFVLTHHSAPRRGDLTPRDLISRAVTSADCLDRATRR